MPAKSKAQQRFFGAELSRAKAGSKTKTGLSIEKLREFASTHLSGLPKRKKKKSKASSYIHEMARRMS